MPDKKFIIEVSRTTKDGVVTVRTEVDKQDEITSAINELSKELNERSGLGDVLEKASVQEQRLDSLTPSPRLMTDTREMPLLENPPYGYAPADAVVEILNPKKSKWAMQGRSVKEIQDRLIELGVQGVSSIQTFDGVMRRLLKQGKVRRENVGEIYKYYIRPDEGVTNG